MKNCLMIMQAREIKDCIQAFKDLQIPKVWFKGYTEKGLEKPINNFIASTSFDNYLISSDDALPIQRSLDVILKALESLPVVTGWSNISPSDRRANVMLKPGFMHPFIARWFDVFNTSSDEVLSGSPRFRTYFTGLSFFGMRRELWLKYPFKVWSHPFNRRGFASDYVMSKRLTKDGVAMICCRDAFEYHLASRENMIVGKTKPHIVLDLT